MERLEQYRRQKHSAANTEKGQMIYFNIVWRLAIAAWFAGAFSHMPDLHGKLAAGHNLFYRQKRIE